MASITYCLLTGTKLTYILFYVRVLSPKVKEPYTGPKPKSDHQVSSRVIF